MTKCQREIDPPISGQCSVFQDLVSKIEITSIAGGLTHGHHMKPSSRSGSVGFPKRLRASGTRENAIAIGRDETKAQASAVLRIGECSSIEVVFRKQRTTQHTDFETKPARMFSKEFVAKIAAITLFFVLLSPLKIVPPTMLVPFVALNERSRAEVMGRVTFIPRLENLE